MKNRGNIKISKENSIKFEDVMVVTPNGNILVESLSFELKRGDNLIISGPNGCGKSSLFRILGNLWPLISGRIERPKIECLFYLPQRPYLSMGPLIDQFVYPSTTMKSGDVQIIKQWLKFVDLVHLLGEDEDFYQVKDWKQVLSEGEKQRVAMARLLYHKPYFAILDECSSRVSADMESKFYKKTRDIGISLFTIAHRVSLYKYHDRYLKIEKDGKWEIITITTETLKQIEHDHSPQTESSDN